VKPLLVQKRDSALAGTWYPSEGVLLREHVEAYLEAARQEGATATTQPMAIVAPHAGLTYAGPTAAHSFLSVKDRPDRIILIGPAHRVAFQGISAGAFSHYVCPLGELPVDQDAVLKLRTHGFVCSVPEAHDQEHCLEMMMPFILALWDSVPIVPLLVSHAEPADVVRILEEIMTPGDLLVVSTDLSHFLPYDEARNRDLDTLHTVLEGRWRELGPHDACGYVGLSALIQFAHQRHFKGTLLDYRNSGDTSGDQVRVVGYGALAYRSTDSK
jgi:AmmeMemoRadiSam system protein B